MSCLVHALDTWGKIAQFYLIQWFKRSHSASQDWPGEDQCPLVKRGAVETWRLLSVYLCPFTWGDGMLRPQFPAIHTDMNSQGILGMLHIHFLSVPFNLFCNNIFFSFSSKLPIKGYGISLRGVWCPTFFISFPQFHIIEAKYQVSATERSKDSYSTQPPYWSDDRPWILGPWLPWASSLIGWMLQSRIDKESRSYHSEATFPHPISEKVVQHWYLVQHVWTLKYYTRNQLYDITCWMSLFIWNIHNRQYYTERKISGVIKLF